MSVSASTDAKDESAALAGTKLTNAKWVALAKDPDFLKIIQIAVQAQAATGIADGLDVLLRDPLAFSLIIHAIPQSTAASSPVLTQFALFREEYENRFYALTREIHNGLMPHEKMAKACKRALFVEPNYWVGFETNFMLGLSANGQPFPIADFLGIKLLFTAKLHIMRQLFPLLISDAGVRQFIQMIQELQRR